MTNSTWFDCTNRVLGLAGLDQITDENTFDTLAMPKYQTLAKYLVLLANQMLSIRATRHFAERLIILNINAGTTDYAIDTGISPENIQLRTFFNVSTASPAKGQNREIRNWKYEEYLRKFPDQTIITRGSPQRWILLPVDRTLDSPEYKVRIYPVPDQNYSLQYQAKLNAQPLEDSGSLILWPPEYEHALWLFAWNLLERDLGEGKEGNLEQLAREAAAQVRLASGVPADVRNAPTTMRLPTFRRRFEYYNSPQSVDSTTGAVID